MNIEYISDKLFPGRKVEINLYKLIVKNVRAFTTEMMKNV